MGGSRGVDRVASHPGAFPRGVDWVASHPAYIIRKNNTIDNHITKNIDSKVSEIFKINYTFFNYILITYYSNFQILGIQRLFLEDLGFPAPISLRLWLLCAYFMKTWVIQRLFEEYLDCLMPIS